MRKSQIERRTWETDIKLSLDLDGGKVSVKTGIGFFDHMLTALAVHGGFGLEVVCKGDLEVDGHHTVEDVGIVLGKAMSEALGDKTAIKRYGCAYIPMDEALARAVVDVSGRPFLVFDAEIPERRTGEFDCCLTEEFFRAFAIHSGITLHLSLIYGSNAHHKIEVLFKACAHALKAAVAQNKGVLSTKGTI